MTSMINAEFGSVYSTKQEPKQVEFQNFGPNNGVYYTSNHAN